MKDKVLALAEELDGVSFKENCDQCLACGTALCRGDLECAESAHKACAKRLREIVERDACEDTTVSAYDLLPDEDRKAIAWVREHGGLDEVEKRIMPAGYEWPRFEDGELAKFGDEHENGKGNASPPNRVCFYLDGTTILGRGQTKVRLAPGKRVKRPAPKVLDADGVPIREGDTVWSTRDSKSGTVVYAYPPGDYGQPSVKVGATWHHASDLTHAKPEQPDTWERLEHDAEKTVCEYFGANYDCANCPLESARCAEEVKKDIIRRAKKLAERGA